VTTNDVRIVCGKPHEICIRETFTGLSETELTILVNETMIEDNLVVEQRGGEIYPGVTDGLAELSKHYKLFIVSNCQNGYIETFLKLSGFKNHFIDFECWGNTGKSKSENLADVIRRNSLTQPIMVGDMESDLVAARKCQIPFYHMKYGLGSVTDFDNCFDSFTAFHHKMMPCHKFEKIDSKDLINQETTTMDGR